MGDIKLDKNEFEELYEREHKAFITKELEWDEYPGNLPRVESSLEYFKVLEKFQNLISKFYLMSVEDWEEIGNIYDTYCKLDGDDSYVDVRRYNKYLSRNMTLEDEKCIANSILHKMN